MNEIGNVYLNEEDAKKNCEFLTTSLGLGISRGVFYLERDLIEEKK